MKTVRALMLGLMAIICGFSRYDDSAAKYKNGTWSFSLVPPPFFYAKKPIAKIIAFFSLPPGDDSAPGEEVWVYESMDWALREGLSEIRGGSAEDLSKTTTALGGTSGTRYAWSSDGVSSRKSLVALVVPGKDCVFVVRCRAEAARFGDLKGAFESSLASFRVDPDPPASKDGPVYADAAWGFSIAPVVFPQPSLSNGPVEIARFMGPSQPNYPMSVQLSVRAQGGSLDDFERATARDLEQMKPRKELNLTLTPMKRCRINSLPAVEVVFSYDSMSCGRNNKFLTVCIEGPRACYVLTAEALESEFDQHETAFRKSISSFSAEK